MDYRIGVGLDSHRFSQDGEKGLVLGGVVFSDEVKLVGNSDADVVLHSIFNAVSSGMGWGSISLTADEMCLEKGITDSSEYLKVLMKKVWDEGFEVNNLSIVIEGKQPKIEPKVEVMKNAISEILKIEKSRIGITATSGEGLSDVGRGLGLQCHVNVSLITGKN